MVVSAAASEFETCMADRKAKSLFEVALVAKYLSQLQLKLPGLTALSLSLLIIVQRVRHRAARRGAHQGGRSAEGAQAWPGHA
jgi:hypothetical protein